MLWLAMVKVLYASVSVVQGWVEAETDEKTNWDNMDSWTQHNEKGRRSRTGWRS
jgi:hypothetical protein